MTRNMKSEWPRGRRRRAEHDPRASAAGGGGGDPRNRRRRTPGRGRPFGFGAEVDGRAGSDKKAVGAVGGTGARPATPVAAHLRAGPPGSRPALLRARVWLSMDLPHRRRPPPTTSPAVVCREPVEPAPIRARRVVAVDGGLRKAGHGRRATEEGSPSPAA